MTSATSTTKQSGAPRKKRLREPRQRGGQPGNTNALKHGFYSRKFRDLELDDLDTAFEIGLANEIALLRVATRRFFELSEGVQDLEDAGRILSLLATSASKLAAITRVQQMLGGDQQDSVMEAIRTAITQSLQEKLDHESQTA